MQTVTRVVTVEKEKDKIVAPAARDGGWKDKCTALEDASQLRDMVRFLIAVHGLLRNRYTGSLTHYIHYMPSCYVLRRRSIWRIRSQS